MLIEIPDEIMAELDAHAKANTRYPYGESYIKGTIADVLENARNRKREADLRVALEKVDPIQTADLEALRPAKPVVVEVPVAAKVPVVEER